MTEHETGFSLGDRIDPDKLAALRAKTEPAEPQSAPRSVAVFPWNDMLLRVGELRAVVNAGGIVERDDAVLLLDVVGRLVAHVKQLPGGLAALETPDTL